MSKDKFTKRILQVPADFPTDMTLLGTDSLNLLESNTLAQKESLKAKKQEIAQLEQYLMDLLHKVDAGSLMSSCFSLYIFGALLFIQD